MHLHQLGLAERPAADADWLVPPTGAGMCSPLRRRSAVHATAAGKRTCDTLAGLAPNRALGKAVGACVRCRRRCWCHQVAAAVSASAGPTNRGWQQLQTQDTTWRLRPLQTLSCLSAVHAGSAGKQSHDRLAAIAQKGIQGADAGVHGDVQQAQHQAWQMLQMLAAGRGEDGIPICWPQQRQQQQAEMRQHRFKAPASAVSAIPASCAC